MTRGKMIECTCKVCGIKFEAREADRKRGWAKCCSKSCATTLSNYKTGKFKKYCYMKENYGGFDNTSCQNEE